MKTVPAFDVIVLAGGRGSRLGGVDKAAIRLGNARLVDRTVRAARTAGAARIIVVGPPGAGIEADRVVREDPPFTGPLEAVAAGLAEVTAPHCMLLACDLVRPEAVIAQLRTPLVARDASPGDDRGDGNGRDRSDRAIDADDAIGNGHMLIDAEGHRQWLATLARTAALRTALASLAAAGESLANRPLRALLEPLALDHVAAPVGVPDDIDTPAELAAAHERIPNDDSPETSPA